MPRLIYKDNLIEMCNAFADSSKLLWKAVWKEFAKTVEEIAEVDAEPVRHGHWVRQLDTRFGRKLNDIIICSCCGIAFSTEDMIRRSYCPNCGAKMDEVREDEI